MATMRCASRPLLRLAVTAWGRAHAARLASTPLCRLRRQDGPPTLSGAAEKDRVQIAGRALSTVPATESSRPRSLRRVLAAVDNRAAGTVDLTWSYGELTPFPYVWLRDSCLCDKCYHQSSRQRLFSMEDLDINIMPSAVENDLESEELTLVWPDGHKSRFSHSWLAEYTFTKRQIMERNKRQRPLKSTLWDRSTMQHNIFKVDYKHLMEELPVLKETLKHLQTHGLLVVTGSPTSFGVVEKISNRIGHTRHTHYGKTFRVASKVDANNLAYTTEFLPLHLDLPFYNYVPGVQLLHCISQHVGSGGENILADSFYVAEIIRQQQPDLFHLLSTVPFEFHDIGEETESHDCRFHKIQEHLMFKQDTEGNVVQVSFNNHVRSYRMNVPSELVKPMYEGLKLFFKLCMAKENQVVYKMAEGDVLVFNNVRVMHGRQGYSVTQTSERVLEGAYADWDEVTCRYRVVNEILNERAAND